MADEKFTGISLQKYVCTTGFIMRHHLSSRNSKLLGYCLESPADVFKELFKNYYVTSFDGLELFDNNRENNPMNGLAIYSKEPVFGIQGSVRDFSKLDILKQVRRKEGISKREISEITNNLKGKYDVGVNHAKFMAGLKPDSEEAREYWAGEKKKEDIILMVESFR